MSDSDVPVMSERGVKAMASVLNDIKDERDALKNRLEVMTEASRGSAEDAYNAIIRAKEAEERVKELEKALRAERDRHRRHCSHPDCDINSPAPKLGM